MQIFSLKPGLAVTMNDRYLVFRSRLVDRRLHFSDDLGEPVLLKEKEFYTGYVQRSICVIPDQPKLGYIPLQRNAPRDLSTYPPEHAAEALRRRPYVEALLAYSGRLPGKEELKKIVTSVWKEVNTSGKAPSVDTVRRWLSRYKWKSVTALVPLHEQKGRNRLIYGDLEKLLLDVINEIYLTDERKPVAEVFKEFEGRIKEHNQRMLSAQNLSCPSRMTVYRYIQGLDPFLVDTKRLGQYTANQKHRRSIGQLKVSGICHRWEIDHTFLDVMLIDPETGLVIGRPYLTVVLDRYSRMVMAYLLHFAAPNTESVLRVIEKAICPKDFLLQNYPKVANSWPAQGLPRQLVPDNAAEFHAGDLMAAFDDLGIEVLYPRSRGPQMKGAVERFFGTTARGFVHQLPGTTFANVPEKGEYDSVANACLTFEDLDALVMKWILDIYHQTPHRGLKGRTPDHVWRAAESKAVIQMPVDLDTLEAVLACRKSAKLHHYGVEVGGQFYHSDLLADLKLQRNTPFYVDVRYRDELGHVWVYDDQRKLFFQVPCKDQRLVGVSRDLYNEARNQLRQSGVLNPDVDALLRASREIQEDIQRAKDSKRLSDRRRKAALARNRGGVPVALIDAGTVLESVPVPIVTNLPDIPDLVVETANAQLWLDRRV
ncbi:DDE-type integrase/transposase/recombinase [Pseudomonas gingeri]|uniref:DDE-type integrase/transposase/recombinase n=1 Tax=Pseudomonas gingeri TaxID=117681 RepID=UPI0015A0E243|nr:DDE-type integrase/transposase/recombinase [Pseudomonas gingeri]NWD69171.1 DDE-type integrase/transposase/recombinase [Pseudomonas gingeri]